MNRLCAIVLSASFVAACVFNGVVAKNEGLFCALCLLGLPIGKLVYALWNDVPEPKRPERP